MAKLLDITTFRQLYEQLEDQKKLQWYLDIDDTNYILSNSIDKIILDQEHIDYDEISNMLKKIDKPTDFKIYVHSVTLKYATGSDPNYYNIEFSIYKKGDNYYFKYDFDDIDMCGDVDIQVNKLLPIYPIDKSRIVLIFTKILEHHKLQNKIGEAAFKAKIEKDEQLDDLQWGLGACLTRLS